MVRFNLVLVMSKSTCDPSVLAKKIEELERWRWNGAYTVENADRILKLENRIIELERQDRIGTIGNFCTFLIAITAFWMALS